MRALINKLDEIEAGDSTFIITESDEADVLEAVRGHWTEEQDIDEFLNELKAHKEVNVERKH